MLINIVLTLVAIYLSLGLLSGLYIGYIIFSVMKEINVPKNTNEQKNI